jgi:hypothetical protein
MTDNSDLESKLDLRKRFISDISSEAVLDCFCGKKIIYSKLYHKAGKYYGIDVSLDSKADSIENNVYFLMNQDLSEYTIIDLDSYSNPYLQLFALSRNKTLADKVTVFMTDGGSMYYGRFKNFPAIIRSALKVKNIKIPFLERFWGELTQGMLNRFCQESNYGINLIRVLKSRQKPRIMYFGVCFIKKKVILDQETNKLT